ncbi:ShlB/FhaC/HecB family hemolysin secretion/activation protein [Acinetobacter celticus]
MPTFNWWKIHTVRGFDGDLTLAADRGFYWSNDLAKRHKLMLGFGQKISL